MIRDKIRASQLVNRLENHALSDLELSPTQVNAALGLLKKVVPDLKATEMDVQGEIRAPVFNMTPPDADAD